MFRRAFTSFRGIPLQEHIQSQYRRIASKVIHFKSKQWHYNNWSKDAGVLAMLPIVSCASQDKEEDRWREHKFKNERQLSKMGVARAVSHVFPQYRSSIASYQSLVLFGDSVSKSILMKYLEKRQIDRNDDMSLTEEMRQKLESTDGAGRHIHSQSRKIRRHLNAIATRTPPTPRTPLVETTNNSNATSSSAQPKRIRRPKYEPTTPFDMRLR
eukprot:330152_1